MPQTQSVDQLYRTPLTPSYWRQARAALSSPKMLVFAALMVALTRALSIPPSIPIGHTSLSFGFLARSLCALVCGPVLGLAFGFVEDILGFILKPTGEFFFGYTLSTMLGVLAYALCFYRARITVWRLVLANLLVNLLVNAALGRRLLGLVCPQSGEKSADHRSEGGPALYPVSGPAAHSAPNEDHPEPVGAKGIDLLLLTPS